MDLSFVKKLLRTRLVSQHRSHKRNPRRSQQSSGVRLTFQPDDGWQIIVRCSQSGTYHHVEQVLLRVLEEVRHRIANNVQLY